MITEEHFLCPQHRAPTSWSFLQPIPDGKLIFHWVDVIKYTTAFNVEHGQKLKLRSKNLWIQIRIVADIQTYQDYWDNKCYNICKDEQATSNGSRKLRKKIKHLLIRAHILPQFVQTKPVNNCIQKQPQRVTVSEPAPTKATQNCYFPIKSEHCTDHWTTMFSKRCCKFSAGWYGETAFLDIDRLF